MLQLFRPPVLPYQLTQVCGMVTERDNRWTGLPAPESLNVTFYVFSSDPNVDTRQQLPRPYKEIARSPPCLVQKSQPRWWYPTVDWDRLYFEYTRVFFLFKTLFPKTPSNSDDLERDDLYWGWMEPV